MFTDGKEGHVLRVIAPRWSWGWGWGEEGQKDACAMNVPP